MTLNSGVPRSTRGFSKVFFSLTCGPGSTEGPGSSTVPGSPALPGSPGLSRVSGRP